MYNAPEQKAKRLVFANKLENLIPDTLYEFSIIYHHKTEQIYKSGEIKKLRTFPNNPRQNSNFNIAFGGNIGNLDPSIEMHKSLAKLNPYVAFVGGDITYDSGFKQ